MPEDTVPTDAIAAGAVANAAPYLSGVRYPTDKARLLEAARSAGADESALEELEKIPDREYENPAQVWAAVGDEVRGL